MRFHNLLLTSTCSTSLNSLDSSTRRSFQPSSNTWRIVKIVAAERTLSSTYLQIHSIQPYPLPSRKTNWIITIIPLPCYHHINSTAALSNHHHSHHHHHHHHHHRRRRRHISVLRPRSILPLVPPAAAAAQRQSSLGITLLCRNKSIYWGGTLQRDLPLRACVSLSHSLTFSHTTHSPALKFASSNLHIAPRRWTGRPIRNR